MTGRSDAGHSRKQAIHQLARRAILTTTAPFDVLAIGRSGVDVYPLQIGVGLEDVETFGKFLGGSAANVAVAAARLGNRTALISGVGDDPFGTLRPRRAGPARRRQPLRRRPTASTRPRSRSARSSRPTTSRCTSTGEPSAPDLQIRADEIDADAVRSARLYWSTVTGLSEEPSRSAHFAAWEARDRAPLTVLDLDYRPMFWESPAAATEQVQRALQHVTVAVGNREECEIAVGETNPHKAAEALLDLGVELAIVKQGPRGVLGKTRHSLGHAWRPTTSTWSTASAPEMRSAAACATACCTAGRWRRPCATPTPPAPSSRRGWSARRRCRRPTRSPHWPSRPRWRPSMSERRCCCADYAAITELRAADPGAVAARVADPHHAADGARQRQADDRRRRPPRPRRARGRRRDRPR